MKFNIPDLGGSDPEGLRTKHQKDDDQQAVALKTCNKFIKFAFGLEIMCFLGDLKKVSV